MIQSPTFILFAAALFGAYSGIFTPISPEISLLAASLLAAIALFAPLRLLRALCLVGFCAACVGALAQHQLRVYQNQRATLPTEKALLEGHVDNLARDLDYNLVGIFHPIDNPGLKLWFSLKEGAAIHPVHSGDRLRVRGKIKKLGHALAPGEFDPYWFGFARGVHGRLAVYDPFEIQILRANTRPNLFSSLRARIARELVDLSSPREAGVLLALIVGDTHLFDADEKEIYRNVGAGHLLAVSGLQVSLLALIFFRFFHLLLLFVPYIGRRSLGRPIAAVCALFSIWCFVFLCGAPPSAVRAGLMSSALLFGALSKRHVSMYDSFGVAGLATVLYSPSVVVDPSFLLSYGAVFGLLIASAPTQKPDLLDEPNDWQKVADKIRPALTASLSAGVITLVISAHLFGEIALGGLLANVVLIPIAVALQTPAIFLGVIGANVHSSFLVEVGALFAGTLEALCETFGTWFGHLRTIQAPTATTSWVLFFAGWAGIHALVSKTKWLGATCALLLCALAFALEYDTTPGLRITVLPVGQGDAALFEFPSGQVMLIDGGGHHERRYDLGEEVVLPFLKRRGIAHLDMVVLSHPDGDHLLGLLPVIAQIPTREIWHSGFDASHPLMAELLEIARSKRIKVKGLGELLGKHALGQSTLEVLGPRATQNSLGKPLKTNDRSLVIRVSHLGTSALWPGDIESLGEASLLAQTPSLRSTLVKAPHHGSKTSSGEHFVRATSPQHVVFCTKDDNMWGFPHSQIVKRWQNIGAKTWNTGTHGEITFWLTDQGVRVKPFNVDAGG